MKKFPNRYKNSARQVKKSHRTQRRIQPFYYMKRDISILLPKWKSYADMYSIGSAYKKTQPCLKSVYGELDLARNNFSKNNWARVRNNLDKAIVKSCKAQEMLEK